MRHCKQKYIKDGIDTDSVLYEILKSRDGTTGISIESDNVEHKMSIRDEASQMNSMFGIFGIHRRGNKSNGNEDDVCKPNYDSDDSGAKLSDWDC